MDKTMKELEKTNTEIKDVWNHLKWAASAQGVEYSTPCFATAEEIFGQPERKNQNSFVESDEKLNILLEERNKAKVRLLQTNTQANSKTSGNKTKATAAHKRNKASVVGGESKRITACSRQKWYENFLQWTKRGVWATIEGNGTTNCLRLLNIPGNVDYAALNTIADRTTVSELDDASVYEELARAIDSTMENKAPGGCGLPAEVCKYGGNKLKERFFVLIVNIQKKEQMLQE